MNDGVNMKFVEAVRFIHSHPDESFAVDRAAASIGVSVSSLKRMLNPLSLGEGQ